MDRFGFKDINHQNGTKWYQLHQIGLRYTRPYHILDRMHISIYLYLSIVYIL